MISEFPQAIIYALVTSCHRDKHRDQGSLEKVGFTLAREAWLLDGRQGATSFTLRTKQRENGKLRGYKLTKHTLVTPSPLRPTCQTSANRTSSSTA